jgi:hypothetical protein
LRTLEENAELRRRLARDAGSRKLNALAERFEESAAATEQRAQVIRNVLLTEREGNGDAADVSDLGSATRATSPARRSSAGERPRAARRTTASRRRGAGAASARKKA